MHEDTPTRSSSGMCRLFRLDLAAHGAALASCTAGGAVLESVVLLGAASHHAASIGFHLLLNEKGEEQNRIKSNDALFSVTQLVIWTCCLLLALCGSAMGAHGLFHVEPLDALGIAGFAAPGALAAATTGVLAWRNGDAGGRSRKADALMSGAPAALALCIAFSPLGAEAGKLDAIAGLGLVLMLCARTLIHVGQALD